MPWTYIEKGDCFVNDEIPGLEIVYDAYKHDLKLRNATNEHYITVKHIYEEPDNMARFGVFINEISDEFQDLVEPFKVFCEQTTPVFDDSHECSLCQRVFDGSWFAFYHFRDKHWEPMTKSARKE